MVSAHYFLAGRLRALGLSGVLWTWPEGPGAGAASPLCDYHARRSPLRSSGQSGAGAWGRGSALNPARRPVGALR